MTWWKLSGLHSTHTGELLRFRERVAAPESHSKEGKCLVLVFSWDRSHGGSGGSSLCWLQVPKYTCTQVHPQAHIGDPLSVLTKKQKNQPSHWKVSNLEVLQPFSKPACLDYKPCIRSPVFLFHSPHDWGTSKFWNQWPLWPYLKGSGIWKDHIWIITVLSQYPQIS